MIRVQLFPPQTLIGGRRLHHGLVGVALLAVPDWRAQALGLLLIVHDRRDAPVWVRDLVKHPEAR